MKTLLVCLLAFVFAFNSFAIDVPSWMNEPTPDTRDSFISAGSGDSIEAAKNKALDILSQRLIVNVQNETELQTEKNTESTTQTLISDSVYRTEMLPFYKVQIIDSINIDGEYYVQISVNRLEVLKAVNERITSTISPLFKDNDSISAILSHGLTFDKFWPTYSKYLALLNAYQFPVKNFEAQLFAFQQQYRETKALTSFSVIGPEQDEFSFTSNIREIFLKKGFAQRQVKHQLQIVLVGPEICYANRNGNHAYKLQGEVLYILAGELILQNDIDILSFDFDKTLAKQQLQQQFFAHLPTAP